MKFSWTLIKSFINLNNINFNDFREQLTLSGIEVESIETNQEIDERILNISITNNRKEIFCALNLAKEIGTILNIPLKISPIKLVNERNINKETDKNISNIRVNKINKINTEKTPKWLLNHLKLYKITKTNLISNIQNYIQIKWGYRFYILDTKNVNNIIRDDKTIKYIKNFSKEDIIKLLKEISIYSNKDKVKNYQIIIFTIDKPINISNDIYINSEYYENAYLDTIRLISTLTSCTISRSYNKYKEKQSVNTLVKINKNEINTLLGGINNYKLQFLSTNIILKILQQLDLSTIYSKKTKLFTVKVPDNRTHDITRKIDIIEEIGRIYKFNNFFNKPNITNLNGSKSTISLQIKKIRSTLRNLGFNEVINCCLINNPDKIASIIPLYNPITTEQKELRHNLLDNLINNYKHNIKHKHNQIEIFEIGKIFEKNKHDTYIEKKYLGGLLYNIEYIKSNWSEKTTHINIFHVKGILEIFLEQLNAKTILKAISNKEHIESSSKLFKKNRMIGIYNEHNHNLIGRIGELNKVKSNILDRKQEKIYIFEIDIQQLNLAIIKNNHLKHEIRSYSNYPSVIRDISITLKKHQKIDQIKDSILKKDKNLIESIKVFNEYTNDNEERFIGIRITYRAKNRTLNTKDIENINRNLQHII